MMKILKIIIIKFYKILIIIIHLCIYLVRKELEFYDTRSYKIISILDHYFIIVINRTTRKPTHSRAHP